MNKTDQTIHEPTIVFIVGPPRSGGNITLASFDNHPDVLAWPFEFLYFPFFYQVAKGRLKVPASELNYEVVNKSFKAFRKKIEEHANGIYTVRETRLTENKSFDFGGFEYQFFLENLSSFSDKCVTAVEYLFFLFRCLKKANNKYRNKEVKYYMIFIGARGFDWDYKELLETSRFLFTYREAEKSYASIREKLLRKNGSNYLLSPTGKKSLLYWVETYRRISNYARSNVNRDNFFVIPLKDLQADSEAFLRRICVFLNIEPCPSIYDLSIFGTPYKGNANDSKLNQGKICKRTSKPRTPLCSFEKRAFALVDLFDFPEGKPRKMPPFGLVEMIQKAFLSAFIEIPKEKIVKRKKLPIGIFLERVLMFFNLCLIYVALKNTWLKMKFIKKGNKHVVNNPFWV